MEISPSLPQVKFAFSLEMHFPNLRSKEMIGVANGLQVADESQNDLIVQKILVDFFDGDGEGTDGYVRGIC